MAARWCSGLSWASAILVNPLNRYSLPAVGASGQLSSRLRADVAVLHIALRRILDLQQIFEFVDALHSAFDVVARNGPLVVEAGRHGRARGHCAR